MWQVWSLRAAVAVCITDAYSDPRFDARVDRDTGFVSRDLLAVPVLTSAGGSEYVGCVVEAMNQRENGFSASHEKLLSTIALQISDRLLPDLIEHMVQCHPPMTRGWLRPS